MGREKAAFKPLNAYLLMADRETDENWEILHDTQSIENWARAEITGKIGYDPTLTPFSKPSLHLGWKLMKVTYRTFAKVLKDLIPVKENLIDMVSADPKPTDQLSHLWVLKQEFSGMNSHDKVAYLKQKMKEYGCDCYIITALDEIAWLLNSNPTPAAR